MYTIPIIFSEKTINISHNEIWRSEFYKNVSAEDSMQYIDLNQLKREVIITFQENEKITTKFEAASDKDVIKKSSRRKFIQISGSVILNGKSL